MKTCKFCDWVGDKPVLHLSECQHAPEEARESAREVLKETARRKDAVACCPLRKKILFKPFQIPTELCGVDDSAVLDVMTFDQVEGIDILCPRFCPWCGKPWVTTGMVIR